VIAELQEHPWIITSARLAKAYGCSPLDLLDKTYDEWAILLACAKVTSADAEAERKRNER
jgi:hypothetical protein